MLTLSAKTFEVIDTGILAIFFCNRCCMTASFRLIHFCHVVRADMPDKERGEEVDRLKGYVKRYEDGLAKATEGRKKFDIK